MEKEMNNPLDFTNEYDDSLREDAYLKEERDREEREKWEYLDELELEEQTLNYLNNEET